MHPSSLRIIFALALLLGGTGPPSIAQPTESSPPSSSLAGKILGSDGKPVAGATVLAYHLSSEEVFRAETNRKGDFALPELPYGYFDLGIETTEGVFIGTKVINVEPSTKSVLSLTLEPSAPNSAPVRQYPGSDLPAVGLAEVKERLRGKDFWRSPKGIAIIAAAGGVLLLALATSGGDETEASPF